MASHRRHPDGWKTDLTQADIDGITAWSRAKPGGDTSSRVKKAPAPAPVPPIKKLPASPLLIPTPLQKSVSDSALDKYQDPYSSPPSSPSKRGNNNSSKKASIVPPTTTNPNMTSAAGSSKSGGFQEFYIENKKAEPSSGLAALQDLQKLVEDANAEITKELKKKRILGLQLGGYEKVTGAMKNLCVAISELCIRICTEPAIYKEVSSGAICASYRPITSVLQSMAMMLRDAGDGIEGYAKYGKKGRAAMEKATSQLGSDVAGLVNCLLGKPLKSKRMSNAQEAERLYQSGQQTLSLFIRAKEAWAQGDK